MQRNQMFEEAALFGEDVFGDLGDAPDPNIRPAPGPFPSARVDPGEAAKLADRQAERCTAKFQVSNVSEILHKRRMHMRPRRMSTANYQDVVLNAGTHTKSCKSAGKVLQLKRAQTAQREDVKAALRIWLESVRAQSGDSWEQIGNKSNVSPTNITRFMKPGSNTGLGIETIRKVAATYGITPPSGLALDFLAAAGMNEPEALHWEGPAPAEDRRPGKNGIDWWVMNSWLLDLEGILKGDRLAFDLNRQPKPGDIVVAQQTENGEVSTVIRKFEPPMLTCRTTQRDYPRAAYVDGDRVIIMGTMVALRRDMVSAAE